MFDKTITISGAAPAGKATANAAPKTSKKTTAAVTTLAAAAPIVRFFPEGGAMVNDLSNMVAVKAEDAAGKGISASGFVISAAGDTVARFTCDTLGMGLFAILPLTGQTYRTKAVYQGQAIGAQLPAALSSGLSLKVARRDTLIAITVSCNAAGAAAYAGKSLSLVVKHAGLVYVDQPIQLTDNVAALKIADNILPEGIAAITLYDDQHKPNCERLLYIQHNNRQASLTVSTDKTVYKPRERVNINIRATDANKQPVTGDFSLAAVDANIDLTETNSITTYLMLQSEIKGRIEHAERYFDTTNVNRARQLDLLMLTQGWRDFVWRRLADTAIKISYLPEQGFTFTGSVKKESGKQAGIPNSNVTLNIPKAPNQKLFVAQTDQAGNYYFDNLQIMGQQVVTVTTRDDKGKANGEIQLDSLSKHELPINRQPVITPVAINSITANEIERRASANKQLDSVTALKEVKVNANRNVRLADQNATPSGYADEVLTVTDKDVKDFKTLRQYILYASNQAKPDPQPDQSKNREIVFYADGKNYAPRIIVENKEEVFTDEDNNDATVLNHYYDQYYDLSMDKVEKVVIKRLINNLKIANSSRLIGNTPANVMGPTVSTGSRPSINFLFVIYLTLKPGALLRNGGGITSSIIQGYYEARSFYKPIHNTNYDSAKPDLRNTIHWEPVIKTDANGQATVSFYNADPKTNIRIVVQGITDKGEPVNVVKGYAVK